MIIDTSSNDSEVALVGVDWLTLTGLDHDGMSRIINQALKWQEDVRHIYSLKTTTIQGYSGLLVGPVFVGVRHNEEYMIRVSGDEAGKAVEQFDIGGFRATRLDLQVTVRLEKPRNIADVLESAIVSRNKKMKRPYHWVKYKSATGSTLSLNKRTGPVFLRCYDKSLSIVEDTGQNCTTLNKYWRLEVEYKGQKASTALKELLLSNDKQALITSLVQSEFNSRAGYGILLGDVVDTHIRVTSQESTWESKLQWLKLSVRPVVGKLIAAGRTDDVFAALGLDSDTDVWSLEDDDGGIDE